MKYILVLLCLITTSAYGQKIIESSAVATQSALVDSSYTLRSDLPRDTIILVSSVNCSLGDNIDVPSFSKINIILNAALANATITMPEAFNKETYIYVTAKRTGVNACGLFFNGDLNGFQSFAFIEDLESAIYTCVKNPAGGYMWSELKSANIDENCNYVYESEDAFKQDSWLKAVGRMYNIDPRKKHENTCICGFRHTPELRKIEVLDYWHISGECDNGIGRSPIGAVDFKERFAYWLEPNYAQKTVAQCFLIQGQKYGVVRQFENLPRISWPVGGWAGGTVRSVQAMSFRIDPIINWRNDLPV